MDEGDATEISGSVWYGSLHWSGNFKIDIEHDYTDQVIVTAGVNDYDCTCCLEVGESFESPLFTIGFSDCGYEKMTRTLYDFQYDFLSPQKKIKQIFPIIYNTWYPYVFQIDEEKCLALIDRAKDAGAELFVIDDGWFGKRTQPDCNLGDWYCDTKRFPQGLKPIAEKAHRCGLKFGIWAEPEMINLDSELATEIMEHKIIRSLNPNIDVTLHRLDETTYISVAVNYDKENQPAQFAVKNAEITKVLYGDINQIMGCDAAIFKLQLKR